MMEEVAQSLSELGLMSLTEISNKFQIPIEVTGWLIDWSMDCLIAWLIVVVSSILNVPILILVSLWPIYRLWRTQWRARSGRSGRSLRASFTPPSLWPSTGARRARIYHDIDCTVLNVSPLSFPISVLLLQGGCARMPERADQTHVGCFDSVQVCVRFDSIDPKLKVWVGLLVYVFCLLDHDILFFVFD